MRGANLDNQVIGMGSVYTFSGWAKCDGLGGKCESNKGETKTKTKN
jgi:hypothetical protein